MRLNGIVDQIPDAIDLGGPTFGDGLRGDCVGVWSTAGGAASTAPGERRPRHARTLL